MKKILKSVATIAALLVPVLMISCASTPLKEPLYTNGMIENATPENSVIVYGYTSEPGIKLMYVDEANGWQALIDTDDREFALPPAHKGAKLVLKDSNWVKHAPGVVQYGNRIVTEDYLTVYSGENDEFNVTVPTDKPLYFMGYRSIQGADINSWEEVEALINRPGALVFGVPKSKEEYDTWYPQYLAKREMDCLKKLQATYAGTVWEATINERIAEVNETLAELKKK
ncbi:MAG: hypothetical protein IJ530_08495 [Treponema sp.]|uniref:hypothetical protein n=1 Tax=Treponema sp. TaxID=166 RepID=UPI0025D201D7|nr:hypothetical protein [Treponema sp.]MBQ8679791.1 hypothetical protein [Treponema sp.]